MALVRPLPETDGLAAAYWQGTSEGRLLIQRCASCGRHQHYARPHCVACGNRELAWEPALGNGVIWSYTVVHRGPYDDLQSPYVVALVRLEEGIVLLSHVVGARPEDVRCDAAVELAFEDLRDGVRLPVFRLAGGTIG
jgi:uncharacterized OB-fold protein